MDSLDVVKELLVKRVTVMFTGSCLNCVTVKASSKHVLPYWLASPFFDGVRRGSGHF
jgi:hypothetical protein